MIWTVRHLWPSGARFSFNVYGHGSILIIRGADGTVLIIMSREGVTQGDPMAMVAYGLMLLPLIKLLEKEHPDKLGPARGYYPEPSKSILVVQETNLVAAKAALGELGFPITTANRFLGRFIGEAAPQEDWVREQTAAWAVAVTTLAKKSLQQEWQFLQRVTDGISTEFQAVESSLKDDFLPALLGQSKVGQPLRDLLALPVQHAGIAIPNPTTSAGGNFHASTIVCGHLVASLRKRVTFNGAEHTSVIKEGQAAM
eukprot:scaffold309707_cov49-Attheya_sp.AAC.1